LAARLVDAKQFDQAEKESKEKDLPLLEYLPEAGLISDEHLGRLVADYFKYEYINLKKEAIDPKALDIIPELVARSRGVISFAETKKGLRVGMLNPDDLEIIHFIEKRAGRKVLPYFITKMSLQNALYLYKVSLSEEFDKILSVLGNKSLPREQRNEVIVRMVDTLLMYSYQNNASDIHIEPYRKKILVRFRIDGILHDVLSLPKDLLDLLVTRIKILAKIRIDEHRAAQDGKFRFDTKDEIMDIRVSVVPVTEGENVVMRTLSSRSRRFELTELGLVDKDLEKVMHAIRKPTGMILVTGPTGSGKTTTLYGVLKILNTRDVHIATIEDPVEYDIEGISQIQVNPRTNLTFAKGLRAVVRQDPDIIMVGEIRDTETAKIAINAAMTGHLLLSTLHANDIPTTFPRLIDMGVESFLIVSSVNVVIAQRLVRQICESCRTSYTLTKSEMTILKSEKYLLDVIKKISGKSDLSKLRLYKGTGCKSCGNTGYSGRTGIFEVMEMSDEISALINQKAPAPTIEAKARELGMTTMLQDGIAKAFRGITTIDEVMKASKS